jgi:hypothetical protein
MGNSMVMSVLSYGPWFRAWGAWHPHGSRPKIRLSVFRRRRPKSWTRGFSGMGNSMVMSFYRTARGSVPVGYGTPVVPDPKFDFLFFKT